MAELLTVYISRERRGMHPGAHVGVQLIIVLLASLGAGICGVFAVEFTGFFEQGTELYSILASLMRALFAFAIILWIMHFFLFIRACVETHIVNSTNKARRITYVRVPVPVPMPMDQIPPQHMVAGQHPMPPQQNIMYNGYYAPVAQQPSTTLSGSQQQPAVPPQGYYAAPA